MTTNDPQRIRNVGLHTPIYDWLTELKRQMIIERGGQDVSYSEVLRTIRERLEET